MTLYLRIRQRTRPLNLLLVRRIIGSLLSELLEIKHGELGLYFVTTSEITHLNETYLHHAGSTDVITFDYAEKGRAGCPQPAVSGTVSTSRPALHGEIFICVGEAMTQARKFRTNWQTELVRYAVHGTLHLLHYDDQQPGARRKMKREEDRLLRALADRFDLKNIAGTEK